MLLLGRSQEAEAGLLCDTPEFSCRESPCWGRVTPQAWSQATKASLYLV